MNLENQQNLTRLREEMMFRMYESEMDDYNEPNETNNKTTNNNNNNATAIHKTAEQEKKRLERKIIELTRNNSKLSSEV